MFESNVEKMLRYCSSIAKEFEAKLNRVRFYVPDHKPTSGVANEVILRDFLNRLSTQEYKVSQGFICDPCAPEIVSRQCDILVYNQFRYPLVYSEAGIEVVFPQAVRMVIEVKTGFGKRDLQQALDNIRIAKQMNFLINGVIFAFKSPNAETVIRGLKEFSRDIPLQYSPIAVLLLDKGVIIHRWPGIELGGGENPYRVCHTKQKESSVVIAFLLLLFYNILMMETWGSASIWNMIKALLEVETELIEEFRP